MTRPHDDRSMAGAPGGPPLLPRGRTDALPLIAARFPRHPDPFLLDADRSSGTRLVSAADGQEYLDFAGFHGSQPLGMNATELIDDEQFRERLFRAATYKPSCSDVFTDDFVAFFRSFDSVFADPALERMMLVEGGSLAVENALKIAFDWKARRQRSTDELGPPGWTVLHLTGSFHGRSGYSLSLTNTRAEYTNHFPRFDWPRIEAPVFARGTRHSRAEMEDAQSLALGSAQRAFEAAQGRIAAFIAEPIQSEGGDNHLTGDFLRKMQELCHTFDALFILDEVQTGGGTTGTPWAYQQFGLEPDIVAFGKKLQVCGVLAGRRLHDVEDHVFDSPGRIGSTWGGNLTDLVRATKIIEVIREHDLLTHVARTGAELLHGLRACSERVPDAWIDNIRGRGFIAALDLPDADIRDRVARRLRHQERVLTLPGGLRTLRFRPPLTATGAEVEVLCRAVERACTDEWDAGA